MLLTIAAFLALCIAYVWWCDRIIGPDPDGLTDDDEADRVTEGVSHEVVA